MVFFVIAIAVGVALAPAIRALLRGIGLLVAVALLLGWLFG
jgi:hypothetical protein